MFAAKLGDGVRWIEAVTSFAAYCAASSAAYLVNDVRDREADRRTRSSSTGRSPGATSRSGEPSVSQPVWPLLALALALLLGTESVVLLAVFAALQAAYTIRLKHVVLADVLTIAALFVVRAAAGAAAVHVPISSWLLVCTGLLALFLALGKRRGERVLVETRATPGGRCCARTRSPCSTGS